MKRHIFRRTDFRQIQDGSGLDFFDDFLISMGIPKNETDRYNEAEIRIDDDDTNTVVFDF
jgi:hypothetical protein